MQIMITLNTVQKEIENNISCWLVVFEIPVLVDEWYRPSKNINLMAQSLSTIVDCIGLEVNQWVPIMYVIAASPNE